MLFRRCDSARVRSRRIFFPGCVVVLYVAALSTRSCVWCPFSGGGVRLGHRVFYCLMSRVVSCVLKLFESSRFRGAGPRASRSSSIVVVRRAVRSCGAGAGGTCRLQYRLFSFPLPCSHLLFPTIILVPLYTTQTIHAIIAAIIAMANGNSQ